MVGELIKRKRDDLGLTGKQLADKFISPSTISRIEKGRQHVDKAKIFYLLKKLDLDPDICTSPPDVSQAENVLINSIESIIDFADPESGIQLVKENVIKKDSKQSHYLLGKAYFKKKYWEKASKHFQNVIQLIPEDDDNLLTTCYTHLSVIAYHQNKFNQALQYIDMAIESFDPSKSNPHFLHYALSNKIGYLYDLEKVQAAYKVIEELWEMVDEIDHIKTRTQVYFWQSKYLLEIEQHEEATKTCIAGINLARRNRLARQTLFLLNLLGQIYFTLHPPLAETCFRASLQIADSDDLKVETYTKLGVLLSSIERFDEAQAALKEAINLSSKLSDEIDALIAYGDLFISKNELDNAINPFEKALYKSDPLPLKKIKIMKKLLTCYKYIDRDKFSKMLEDKHELEEQIERGK